MLIRFFLPCAAVAAMAMTAAPAEAAKLVIVARGKVSGVDVSGVFVDPYVEGSYGNVIGNLDGLSFRAVFYMDTEAPGATFESIGDDKHITYSGPAPLITGTLTINNKTMEMGGLRGFAYANRFGWSEFQVTGPGLTSLDIAVGGAVPADPFVRTGKFYAGDGSNVEGYWGNFGLSGIDPVTGALRQAGGTLATTSVMYASVSGNFPHITGDVPEPSTWSFLICGFGAIGVSLRLKSSRTRARESSNESGALHAI